MGRASEAIDDAAKDLGFRHRYARDLQGHKAMIESIAVKCRAFDGETPREKIKAATRLKAHLGGAIACIDELCSDSVPQQPFVLVDYIEPRSIGPVRPAPLDGPLGLDEDDGWEPATWRESIKWWLITGGVSIALGLVLYGALQ